MLWTTGYLRWRVVSTAAFHSMRPLASNVMERPALRPARTAYPPHLAISIRIDASAERYTDRNQCSVVDTNRRSSADLLPLKRTNEFLAYRFEFLERSVPPAEPQKLLDLLLREPVANHDGGVASDNREGWNV